MADRWAKVEAAKRRLFHTLLHLDLPLETRADASAHGIGLGLTFDFLYDPVGEQTGNVQIMTGHEDGLITLNLLEADDVHRERVRTALGEPYRTILGHFRHEAGHYYWSRLIEHSDEVEAFRALFGDERVSYEEAMAAHYQASNVSGSDDYVSAYAMMHPWEDFAETFAHLLHIVDTLATIGGFGMRMTRWPGYEEQPEVNFDPYRASAHQLVSEWRPFSFAQNSINRSMGQSDLYPFHLSPKVIEKLSYINRLLQKSAQSQSVMAYADA